MTLELKNLAISQGAFSLYVPELALEKGAHLSILAPSGAGKSSFLNGLAGFCHTSGEMRWAGTRFDHAPPEARPLSLLFQAHNLFEHMNVSQNIALGLTTNRRLTSSQQRQISQMLEEVGLAGFETRRTSTLSGGQAQRVALARALLRNRPLLLLDEPFSGLDHDTHAQMRALIKEVAQAHKISVVLVSHDPGDAADLGGAIARITSDTPAQLFVAPQP